MKHFKNATWLILAALAGSTLTTAADEIRAPRLFIEPQNGFESYLTTALAKKHVPVVVTLKRDDAQFVLVGTNKAKGFAGYGYTAGAVQLINQKQEVVWSYTVRKYWNLAQPSVAEAIAKHLKDYLEAHPQ